MSALPLGHVGHWWGSILYLAPVVVVIVFLGVQSWRAKRRDGSSRMNRLARVGGMEASAR